MTWSLFPGGRLGALALGALILFLAFQHWTGLIADNARLGDRVVGLEDVRAREARGDAAANAAISAGRTRADEVRSIRREISNEADAPAAPVLNALAERLRARAGDHRNTETPGGAD